ncbi:MAG: hypothetical protein AAF206_01220 [Bacteroidota bacterium]
MKEIKPSRGRPIFSILIAGLLALTSCSEFLVPDVSEATITIISPQDTFITAQNETTLWWEAHPDGEGYEVQVVRPDFDRAVFLFDTLLNSERLNLNLDQGVYRWRIRINNEASVSTWQSRTFVIDQQLPDQPLLIAPTEGSVQNIDDEIRLEWSSQDIPLDDFQAAVSDSVYLYDDEDRILGRAFFSREKIWRIDDLLPDLQMGESLGIRWQVISIDAAGNNRTGDSFRFQISR